jgi:hypothetical protein
MLSEDLNEVLLKLHRQDDGFKNFEMMDSILLFEDGEAWNSLIKERFITLEAGIWQLTGKGRAYVDAVLLIKKSRQYFAMISLVCILSIALTIITLFT